MSHSVPEPNFSSAEGVLFSIVIPACNRRDLLALCLDCLASGRQAGLRLRDARTGRAAASESWPVYEVIVSDDSTTDAVESLVRESYPWVNWTRGPRRGPAANRNQGAKSARGEWLVFVDDDCLPDSGWLNAFADAAVAHPEFRVFEGRTYADRERRSLAEVSPVNEQGGYLWSCNFTIAREVFSDLGGFDERYPYAAMEDVDLRDRITKRGMSFRFIEQASVCHPWRKAGGWEKLRQYERSVECYLNLHPEQETGIDVRYYLKLALIGLVKETLPGIWNYRGAGVLNSAMHRLFYLRMAWRALRRKSRALALTSEGATVGT